MNVADVLIAGLKNPAPAARVETLRVLAMVEETQALPAMRALAGAETDPDVLKTLHWSGELIARAARNGYTTETALAAYYRIGQKASEDEKKEAEILRRMGYQLDTDLIKMRNQASSIRTVSRGLMFGAIGLMALPMTLSGPSIQSTLAGSGADAANVLFAADPSLEAGSRPITPPRPTDSNISAWTKQLRAGDAKTRRQAATELLGFNNPAALPYLGNCFAIAPEEPVRMEAQRVGKILYFNWYYWAPTMAPGDKAPG
jgi:hypothetical protein